MSSCHSALCFTFLLASACMADRGLPPTTGNNEPSTPSAKAASCSTCSVRCSAVASGFPALRNIGSVGSDVYLIGNTPSGASVVRIGADDAMSTLASGLPGIPAGLAVGPTALAWSLAPNDGSSTVFVLPDEGGAPTAMTAIAPSGNVVVDDVSLYYVAMGSGTLSAVPLLGGAATQVATVSADNLVYVDDAAVYYNDPTLDVVRRQPKDGSMATSLAASAGQVVSDGVSLYSQQAPRLVAIPVDGGPARDLVTWTGHSFYSPMQGTATDGTRVYYIDPECTGGVNMGCAIRSVPVGGGAVSTLCSSIETPILITANANGVYVVDGDTVIELARD